MATTTAQSPTLLANLRRILGIFTGFAGSVGKALVLNSTVNARLEQVHQLQSKSDEELAALGLTRDDILRHVFRDSGIFDTQRL